jgi:hypothetical protein
LPLFSVARSAFSVTGGGDTTIAGFPAQAAPYYTDASLNLATGVWTVPVTGTYWVSAQINYATTAALTVAIGASVDPAFVIRRAGVNLLAGRLPILNVNIALVLTTRVILGSDGITVPGDLQLTAGDQLTLVYVADGLGLTLNLGTAGVIPGVVWSVHRIA